VQYEIYRSMKSVEEWDYVWQLELVLINLDLLTKTGWLGHGND
jgi:hypothetical protein